MGYFVAVDGGGSKTIAALFTEEGNLVAFSKAGPSNPQEVGFNRAAVEIFSAISELFIKAKVHSFSECKWYSIALAGVGREKDRLNFLENISKILSSNKISVVSDLYASYISVFQNEVGIILTIGTGSAAISFNEKGEEIRSGGWGAGVDDEGSGYWIGQQALHALMQSYDGRLPKTQFYDSILSFLSISDATELIYWIKDAKKDKIASLAPVVISLAERRDPIAYRIIENAAIELTKMVWAVWKKLGAKDSVKIAITGSISQNMFFREMVFSKLRETGINFVVEEEFPHPLIGASMIAMKNIGIELSNERINKLRQIVNSVLI